MIPNETTAQDASGSTIAPSGDLRVDLLFHADATAGSSAGTQIGIDRLGKRRARRASSKRPWTLPAPWTRRRAHRPLENRRRFSTASTAILDSVQKRELQSRDQRRPVTSQRQLPSAAAVTSRAPFASPSPAEIVVVDRQK